MPTFKFRVLRTEVLQFAFEVEGVGDTIKDAARRLREQYMSDPNERLGADDIADTSIHFFDEEGEEIHDQAGEF